MTTLLALSPLAAVPVMAVLAAGFHRYRSRINPRYVSASGLPDFLNMPLGRRWPATTPELGETK